MNADEFLSKVEKLESGCWLAPFRNGVVTFNDQRISARKLSFYLHNGHWAKNRVLVTCGNERCIAPAHIYEGANVDTAAFRERFWSGVQPAGDNDCWPWMRACTSKGYGQLYVGDKPVRTHRIAYYLAYGKWPNIACHECDNPICCNPRHITDGTYKLNSKHALDRKRLPYGVACKHTKLSEEQVRLIRQRYTSGEALEGIAKDYGVSCTSVCHIGKGRTWKQLV